ncbi:MAG: mechanosensitive ion channel domain-containing protein [Pseudomonadota bacterium]|nr:mechanosensitive ion channel domain-containing protein [Pseudomonadota bacterium]
MNNFWKKIFKPNSILAYGLILLVMFLYLLLDLKPIKDFLSSETFSFTLFDKIINAHFIIQSTIFIPMIIWGCSIVINITEKAIRKIPSLNSNNRNIFNKASQVLIYFVGINILISYLGIDLGGLTVFSGALGIGIGFGLQKIISNYISGVIILFEKSVQNDDLIELNDGTFGYLRETGSRTSRIETFDGQEVMIPNEDLITGKVINYTHSNHFFRVTIPVGVSYASDISLVREILIEAASEHPQTLDKPKTVCFLREFADSSVNFILHFWIADVIEEGRFKTQSEVMYNIWNKFKEQEIEIPFPQRDINLKEIIK